MFSFLSPHRLLCACVLSPQFLSGREAGFHKGECCLDNKCQLDGLLSVMFPDFVKGEEAKENGEMDADIPLAPTCCLGDLKLPFFFFPLEGKHHKAIQPWSGAEVELSSSLSFTKVALDNGESCYFSDSTSILELCI